jgi:hypothetical protein
MCILITLLLDYTSILKLYLAKMSVRIIFGINYIAKITCFLNSKAISLSKKNMEKVKFTYLTLHSYSSIAKEVEQTLLNDIVLCELSTGLSKSS